MGAITDCEWQRRDGARCGGKYKVMSALDTNQVNACCGNNGRIMLVAALHPQLPAIFKEIKTAMLTNTHPQMLPCEGYRYSGLSAGTKSTTMF